MSKISVIIPIYNTEKYLSKCIESVINQTYKNLEIICVDNCSLDNSFLIADSYRSKDNRIKLYKTEKNGGVCVSRNLGLSHATGEYIYFMDSDDWIDKDFIEHLYRPFQSEEIDFVVTSSINIVDGDHEYLYKHPSADKLIAGKTFEPINHFDDVMWVPWNRMFKSSFLRKIDFAFPTKYRTIAEDLYMQYVTFAMSESAYYTSGSSYHYIQRQDSRRHSVDEGIYHIRAFSEIFDYLKKHDIFSKNIKIYRTMPSYSISDEITYNKYKECCDNIYEHINLHKDLYNPIDLFFINSIVNTMNYAEYTSKYSDNAVISFLKNGKK